MLRRLVLISIPVVALAACGGTSTNQTPDAGVDAGTVITPTDSGTVLDAGSETDAGHVEDAGTETDAGTPFWSAVSTGIAHTCALSVSGQVYCWGDNSYGQVGVDHGDGGPQVISEPTLVTGVEDVVELSARGRHSCARRSDGTVLCWGQNSFGQLGNGTLEGGAAVVQVDSLTGAMRLSTGIYHSCAVTSTGTAACWGNRAGDPNFSRDTTPVEVSGIGEPVISLAAGGEFVCGSLSGGKAVCWGVNSDAQLGDGTTTSRPEAAPVTTIAQVTQVAAGSSHACALRVGSVWCWGTNASGELGRGTTGSMQGTPAQVTGLTNASSIAAGHGRSCAIRTDESLVCWGANSNGALGTGNAGNETAPAPIPNLSGVSKVALGHGGHQCAIATNGGPVAQLYCWGMNSNGQVKGGLDELVTEPALIPAP